MKTSRKILLAILAIVLTFVLIGFFFPAKIELERSRTINAPIEMVYDQVNNLHLWDNWSPWHQIDPNMGITYANLGIGKDASYTWTSDHKQVGNGTMTITDAKRFEFIDTEMDFGDKGMGTAGFKFTETDGKVLVSWDMQSEVGNSPIAKWFGVMMKGMIEKSYDQGLEAIDKRCQELKKSTWYYVKLIEKDVIKYYGIASKQVTMQSMDQVMSDSYTQLGSGIAKAGLEVSAAPFALYYSWGEAYDMECAMPVNDNSKAIKGLEQNELPAQRYAAVKYIGSYDDMESAHEYLMNWLDENNLELAGPVMEVYKIGPQEEADARKWISYILYPVQ